VGNKKSHNNKGGSIASNGYKIIFVGKKHHLADIRGYAYEHRVIAEIKYGRRLLPTEQVHHIDHDKLNNSPENLEIVKSIKHHRFFHRKEKKYNLQLPDEKNISIKCKCGCGKKFMKYDKDGRPRIYVSGHNPMNNTAEKFIFEQIKLGNNTTKGMIDKYGKQTIKTVLSRMIKNKTIERVSLGVYKLNG
jgi:hypothetical protein